MNKRNGLLTILIATGIGYLAGLLLAPQKGDDTRRDLKRQAYKFKHDAERNIYGTVDNVKHTIDDVSHKFDKKIENVKEEKKPFMDDIKNEIVNILDRIEKESKKVKEEIK